MSTSSNGKKAEAKRAELVAAAVRVVMREGIGAASDRAVAQEAQISVGSVLYYFSGIDELLRRTVESVMDRYFAQRLHVLASFGTAAQRLSQLIDLGVPDDIGEDLSRLYKSIALKPTNSEDLALYEGLYKRQVSLYLSIIETGQENGEFTPGTGPADRAESDRAGRRLRPVPGDRSAVERCRKARERPILRRARPGLHAPGVASTRRLRPTARMLLPELPRGIFTQLVLADLPGHRGREILQDLHIGRDLEMRQLPAAVLAHGLDG